MMRPVKMKLALHIVVHERTLTLDSTKKDRREKKELSREERSERSTDTLHSAAEARGRTRRYVDVTGIT